MGTVQPTAEELVELIQDLRVQRQQADELVARPHQARIDVWTRKTAQLLTSALGDDHYVVVGFQESGAGSYEMGNPMMSSAAAKAMEDRNLRRFLEPHVPHLDEGIAEAEKRLRRMSGRAIPATAIPTSQALPSLQFASVKDARLRAIAARDYNELRVAIHFGSTKSMASLSGCVVEAVVLDLLLANGVRFDDVKQHSAGALYKEAKSRGLLAGRQTSAVDASRDTRNVLHPAVEYREGDLTREQAELGVSLMRAVLSELAIS